MTGTRHGTYEGLKEALRLIPDDETVLLVNAYPFVGFNVRPGGYLSDNGAEYLNAFARYAECSYLEVSDIHDVSNMGWGVVECDPYPFAVPFDAEIEYAYDRL